MPTGHNSIAILEKIQQIIEDNLDTPGLPPVSAHATYPSYHLIMTVQIRKIMNLTRIY
jgi:hypothetical protein